MYRAGRYAELSDAESVVEALVAVGSAPLSERIAILAVGSNGYPRQLLDKFREDRVSDDGLVVVECVVPGAAVAYAASVSRHGYVPVTLRSAGAALVSWLQFLTAEQLTAVSCTEGASYRLVAIDEVEASGPRQPGWSGTAYGWAHERLLDLGEGPIGAEEVSEVLLLGSLRERVGGGGWDGCRLSAETSS